MKGGRKEKENREKQDCLTLSNTERRKRKKEFLCLSSSFASSEGTRRK